MKNVLKAIKFVKSNKKCTSVKHSITSREVERINAGNSTSAWGIVFYRQSSGISHTKKRNGIVFDDIVSFLL